MDRVSTNYKMINLDLYNNTFARAILREAFAQISSLKINRKPSCLIHKDLLEMVHNLNDELYAFNTITIMTNFNNDRQNQSIIVQHHLGKRISNDFYVKLLTGRNAIANALKTTTHENILMDYVKINNDKIDVIQRWEEAREEQKKIKVDEKAEFLTMEIDRFNNLLNGFQLCRQNANLFNRKKLVKLTHQIDHWKQLLAEKLKKMTNEIEHGEMLLQNEIQKSNDLEEIMKERQEIIDDFNYAKAQAQVLALAEVKAQAHAHVHAQAQAQEKRVLRKKGRKTKEK